MSGNYVLDGHTPRLEPDLMKWGAEFRKDRHVGRTDVGEATVSTVFLGIDHNWGDGPPVLFETMVFGGDHDQWTDRYRTWDEAEAGHARVVAALREGVKP